MVVAFEMAMVSAIPDKLTPVTASSAIFRRSRDVYMRGFPTGFCFFGTNTSFRAIPDIMTSSSS